MLASPYAGPALERREHAVLIREMGGLQHRVTHQMRDYAAQVMELERALLDVRAQLLLVRTAILWGLDREVLARSMSLSRRKPEQVGTRTPDPSPDRLNAADKVICQTGCVGHAHPWLETDGQCRRSGLACARVDATAEADPR